MHKVQKTGTYQSQDKTKSVQLNAGEVIDDRDAEDLGLGTASDRDARDDADAETAKRLSEQRAKSKAPENRGKGTDD